MTTPTQDDYDEVASELVHLSERVASWQVADVVPPEPEPSASMLYGCSAPKGIDNLEGQIGVRFASHRCFDGGHPATFQQHDANKSAGKRFVVVSCKWSPWSDLDGMSRWLAGFADSWPDDTDGAMILNHEPEDNGSPAQYRPMQQQASEVWHTALPRIAFGGCWQAWTCNPASGIDPSQWWPGDVWDFLAFDGYNKKSAQGVMVDHFFAGALDYCDSKGVPFAIAEYGTVHDQDRAEFTQQGADLVADKGGPFCTYWNSANTGYPYPWKPADYPAVKACALQYGGTNLAGTREVPPEQAEQDDTPADQPDE